MNNIKYFEYDKKYEGDVINLLNASFKNKSINERSFTWKHFDDFFQGKSVAMVAIDIDTNILCSFVCFTPVTILAFGKKITFYSCAVQVTDYRYRKRGIISDLTLLIEGKLNEANYLGFSNSDGVKIDSYSKRINYNILGQIKTYYLLSKPTWSKIKINKINFSQFEEKYEFESVVTFNYDIDYLRWRYLDNPKNNYTFYECILNDQKIGLIILKRKYIKYEVSILHIKDFSLLDELLKSISHYAFMRGVILTSISLLPNKYTNSIKNSFLYSKDSGIYFTVKTKIDKLNNLDSWFIQGGDIQ